MAKKNKKGFPPEMAKGGGPIMAAVAIRDVNDKFSSYPSDGLTPVKLARIFKEADAGDPFRQMELFEEMESKDTHLFSQLQTRKLAVTGLDWEVQPFSQDGTDQEIAAFVEEQLKELDGFSDNLMDILDAIGKGISFQEIEWEYRDGHVVVGNIEYVHQKKFYYDTLTDALMLRTEAFPGGIPLPENKFIVHRYKARSGHPSRYGVLRVVAWMYLFKNYDLKDWVSFCEVYGMPLRLGTYDATASEKDKAALMDAIVRMGTDAAGIVPSGTDIKFIESNKQSSVDIYERLARFCDEQMSKAIVGQTLTSDSGGSYAQSKTHNDVRKDLTEADCKAVMETVRRDLIRPLVEFNFGIRAHVPYFVLNATDTDDLKETAEIVNTLAATGLEIPKSWLYKKFNIPAPEKGEETIGKAPAAPGMQGMGQPGTGMFQGLRLKADGKEADGQRVLDRLEEAAVKQSSAFFRQMMSPVLELVEHCDSLEGLQEQLKDEEALRQLYNAMKVKDFDQLVEQVMYVSNMLGRMQDG
jgi:phage gp29-like protein